MFFFVPTVQHLIWKEGRWESNWDQKFFYLTLKLYLAVPHKTYTVRVGDKNSSISLYHLFFSPRATLPLLLHARARTYYTRTRGEPRQTRWASRAKEKKKGSLKRERERENSPFTKRRRREGTWKQKWNEGALWKSRHEQRKLHRAFEDFRFAGTRRSAESYSDRIDSNLSAEKESFFQR